MKIHEYQAKEIFGKYGLPIPKGEVVTTPDEARNIAVRYEKPVMIKAQVHVGGRGKAGGIKYCKEPDDAFFAAQEILGMDIKGLIVKKVLVTEAVDIKSEAYVGVIVDRVTKRNVIMVSPAGGIDIEEVAAKTPEKIMKLGVDPLLGLLPYEALKLARFVYPDIKIARSAGGVIRKLYDAFVHSDASLAEINPLVLNNQDDLVALDAKINLDDSALFRHPDYENLRDLDAEDPAEMEAKRNDLSYVKLNGNIGCCVNGAGLAMATMDLVKHFGGEPANFLDIGGSSSPEKVLAAMKIILNDPNVVVILFNIFGGITRCDDVANGMVWAVEKLNPRVPIVVRLTGTNEDKAKKILEKLDLSATSSMEDVVKMAVNEARSVV
ncbi:MAG: succinate--CoA ligase subunit beta [candidate division Zixibacteria bacterium 4484_95]|nr:MAG: succinate--CoA ligase subunit beta [candidate division Zixibacteria bacterium 4484_95]RKX18840.1 MAG: ADP-forming succinate--CoA ligase subunit beta [candidate division Zixibacteria bacterium]